ncbi:MULTISPECIES: hypothetical protein [unclassified Janthinobacterium]|uniref:hypothetical protein n=1 Tax=unclassified Janthinobacterium TaxID=2610881 RepID=UPI0025B0C148|nr:MULTISPECIES: hypothetical protein [unclassified Janthinobacterium]MDN2705660.1 hypothetical protein [Janthinobacterium sp. SUN100]MDO8040358.1 hypothetical protein [Janthinobacterium sp. SUN137]
MLTFSEEQWRAVQTGDMSDFVIAVADQFLAKRADMASQPGRATVIERMLAAYTYAIRIGFRSTPHIVHLMYLSADAPGIHDDPLVDAYLRKPGATPEQRFDELIAVMDKKLEGEQ